MKVLVIDGQGGRIGKMLVEQLIASGAFADGENSLIAIGTNSMATAAMLKAGASAAATGENPVAVNCPDADVIAGPIGIIAADSLLGEVTPRMAFAIARSRAQKVLIPVSRCSITVAGLPQLPAGESVRSAAEAILALLSEKNGDRT